MDALNNPFDLPVCRVVARCIADQPIFLPPRAEYFPGNTVRGLLRRAVWETCCEERLGGGCIRQQGRSQDRHCTRDGQCLAQRINEPRGFGGTGIPVVWSRIPELEEGGSLQSFTWEWLLRGRRVCAEAERVTDAIRTAGVLGLANAGGSGQFDLADIRTSHIASIGERSKWLPQGTMRAKLEFETPVMVPEAASDPLGLLASVMGTRAYYLVLADILDRGMETTREAAEARASAVRTEVEMRVAELTIRRADLIPWEWRQRSGSSGRTFPLRGYLGQIEFEGDLSELYPWLVNLAWDRAGQHGSLGLGVTRLWLDGGG